MNLPKHILASAVILLASISVKVQAQTQSEASRGNFILPAKDTYGYLNCHMSDRGQWTAYALSRDGFHYHDLLQGDSVFSSHKLAGIEGGTRDAYICRRHDNKGYLMVTTDMHNGATKRLNKPDTWCNFGIDLLTSDDLINWKSTTIDFRKWQPTVTRVWAPQVIWDETYKWPNGKKGGYMIYYSMLDPQREKYDRMYYSYANEDFTEITRPQLLFDWGYATIDADINWVEADRKFHMMIKKEGGTTGIFTTTSAKLLGPWPEPDAAHYVDFEGKKKCEGPSAFQLKDGSWKIGYIEYSSRPRHYRLCDANETLTRFSNPQDIMGVNGPQHGSFMRLTREEYERLQAWSDKEQDKRIDQIISQMTLEEKVEMMHSKTNMSSEGVPRLGIQDIKYADGPFGIREEGVPNGFQSAGWTTDSATYFPTGSALAATWSPEMAYKYGSGMGREARLRGKDVILGPAINIQRLPVGGRSYEYLSEDPFLAAQLATQYVLGTQDQGTAACIKHFALNNQETNRGSVNVICDERTIREIYLKPFEAAVREGGAKVVMPAYNKVNGYYCSENEHLLNEILRKEWGFRGFTVSDWGGTHSTMGAALHGLNVQMTGSNYLGQPLIDSVRAGKVPMQVIDNKVRELLRVRFEIKAIPADQCNLATASQPESQRIAYEVATKSVVLLKNEAKALPLKKAKNIAVIGLNATLKTQSGGMGAGVKAPYEITPLQGLQNRAPQGVNISYAPGYKNYAGMFGRRGGGDNSVAKDIHEAADPQLVEEAVALARKADVVIFVCGTNKNIETEGSDRSDIKLPVGQDELVKALAQANSNIVSVVISGGPCDLQEVNKYSKAVVQGWWNGLEGGNALADIIYGKIAPSGKLPFTFPLELKDSPAFALDNFPGKAPVEGDLFGNQYRQDIQGQRAAGRRAAPDAHYTEGMLVGYRWFDTKEKPVLYAFGHGLSYVDFQYANLKADKPKYKDGETITVTFSLTNKGSMEAEEVAQLYVHRINSKVEWPKKELKAFQRVSLKAGETKRVTLQVPVSELRYWDEKTNGWALESGQLELLLGGSSDKTPLTTKIELTNK